MYAINPAASRETIFKYTYMHASIHIHSHAKLYHCYVIVMQLIAPT